MTVDEAGSAWRVERHRGPAGELHALDWPRPLAPTVWLLDVVRPALVLGSTQAGLRVDGGALAARGIEVAGRRSGGGAVLLVPDQCVWIDLFIPPGDRRWDDDVSRSFHWLGEVWVAALAELGLAAEVHRGAPVRTPLTDRVCFAGVAPGEVTVGGQKAVGLSQRRTRAGARFQGVVYRTWDPQPLAAIDGVDPSALPPVVTVARPAALIEAAFLRQLA